MKKFLSKIKKGFSSALDKTKVLLNNLQDKIKKNPVIALLGILVLVFLIITIIYLVGIKKLSSIEEKELTSRSDEIVYYLDDLLLDTDKVDKYIIYSLDYNLHENNDSTMSIEDMYNFIKDNFDIKINKDELIDVGITPLMLSKNITYDSQKLMYTINSVHGNPTDIAETSVNYYHVNKINKKNRKKYIITYQKYVINDPYEVLNYYLENNAKVEEPVDIVPFRNYLAGSGSLYSFVKSIDSNDINKFSKKDKEVKVTIVVIDNKLKINQVK